MQSFNQGVNANCIHFHLKQKPDGSEFFDRWKRGPQILTLNKSDLLCVCLCVCVCVCVCLCLCLCVFPQHLT